MAHKRITVTGAAQFMHELKTFLTTDPALVAAGQNWEVLKEIDRHPASNVHHMYLKGPGNAGSDEVFVNLSRRDDQATVGESVLWIQGAKGFEDQLDFNDQPGTVQYPCSIFLDSGIMEVWLVANGRRFMALVKISTTYQHMYAGLYLPYATPETYSYPMFLGGTKPLTNGSAQSTTYPSSWRATSRDGYNGWAFGQHVTGSFWYLPPAQMLAPDGVWKGVTSLASTSHTYMALTRIAGANQPTTAQGYTIAYATPSLYGDSYNPGFSAIRDRCVAGFDGECLLEPITIFDYKETASDDASLYGIIDGVYTVLNRDAVAETEVTVGGVTYVIFGNIMRSTVGEYLAMALE